MFQDFLTTLLLLSLRDRLFVVIAIATGALLLISLAAAVTIIGFHYYRDRARERWSGIQEELEPLVLDVLAGDRPPEAVWERVRAADALRFTEFLLHRYAHKLRGQELQAIRDLATPYLTLVAQGASSGHPEARAQAIQSLATLGLPDYEEVVIQALGDPSPVVALVSARALADAGGARYVRDILNRMDRFELWSSSFLSVMMASMGPEAVPALEEKYVDRKAPAEVRAICADALGQIGVPEVVETAVTVLEQLEPLVVAWQGLGPAPSAPSGSEYVSREVTNVGDEREVLITSLRILVELGHAEHLPLVRRLSQSADPVVRALAMSGLGEIGEERDLHTLAAGVEDSSRWVAVHAASSLKALRAFDELERIGRTNPDRADLVNEVLSA